MSNTNTAYANDEPTITYEAELSDSEFNELVEQAVQSYTEGKCVGFDDLKRDLNL